MIKNLGTLSREKKTKLKLMFYQDTRMSAYGAQTDQTGISVLKQRLLEVLQVGRQPRNKGFYSGTSCLVTKPTVINLH